MATKGGGQVDGGKDGATLGPFIVAAIDFGTTFSGYAFSFKHDYEKDPTQVGLVYMTPNLMKINMCRANGKSENLSVHGYRYIYHSQK